MFQLNLTVKRRRPVVHLRMKEFNRTCGYQHLKNVVVGLPRVKSQKVPHNLILLWIVQLIKTILLHNLLSRYSLDILIVNSHMFVSIVKKLVWCWSVSIYTCKRNNQMICILVKTVTKCSKVSMVYWNIKDHTSTLSGNVMIVTINVSFQVS